MATPKICDGCDVLPPIEHRCEGWPCSCQACADRRARAALARSEALAAAKVKAGPAPHTPQEIAALPEGSSWSREEYVYTDDEKARGWCLIEGERFEIGKDSRSLVFPRLRDVIAHFSAETDALWYTDTDGVTWVPRLLIDGTWFRERVRAS